MKLNPLLIGLGVLVLVVVIGLFSSYNGLVKKDQAVSKAWAQVEADYQRRADLVPNLVSTVKGAASFEQNTLTAVTQARANATSISINPSQLTPENIAKFEGAQANLSGALGRLLAVAEAYPQLTATESFRGLQTQLEGTENRIAVARKDFNTAVADYDASIRMFPTNLVAGMFGFAPKAYFEAAAGAETAPQVNF
jgi:LemA protein